MPAIVPSTVPRADVSAKSRSSPQPRKTRMVKPRGRGRNNFESDEEFEREAATDSESDDDRSSVATETDSDTEPASEDIIFNGHSHILTPNTTQSSEDVPSLNHQSAKDIDGDSTPFFSGAGNWSEMVAEETANGPAELPVIEFADFNSPSIPQQTLSGPLPRKTSKASKRPQPKRAVSAPSSDRGTAPQHPPVHTEEEASEPADDQPQASTSRQQSRNSFSRPPSGHNARQAYQQRLEADPSYVPTVGEFWGHDDRLLDKDLRSLSGWWRGRWQGRGRGRGGFSGGFVRGRGRGAFAGPESSRPTPEASGSQETEKPPVEPPLIDQLWTHDGFEEMKKRDEKRRTAAPHQPQQAARSTRGFLPLRGRGGFIASRGRGGFARGGFSPSSTGAHFIPPAAAAAASGRTWYAMKPERVWTKQHEGFLYFDPALKPRPGQGPGYRVKLSGNEGKVVRSSARTTQAAEPAPSVTAPSEASEKTFIVRLPKRAGKEKASEPAPEAVETITTIPDPPIEDVFTVRPGLVPPRQPIPNSQSSSPPANDHKPSTSVHDVPPKPAAPAPSSPDASMSPKENITSPLLQQMMRAAADQQAKETADVPNGILQEQYDQNAPALLQIEQPASNPESSDTVRPSMPPPLQTVFSPPTQPSPPYGSPYGYGSPLPPGVAIGHHGMPYEIATGRAVYLQHPTMYTPRPLAHGMMTPPGLPYAPMHHHSASSPDFLAPSHTPPVNGYIDPSTGNPLFAFPRQSSRVEIRSPSSHSELKQLKSTRRPSTLRTSAASFEPSRPASPNTESQTYQSSADHSAQDDASSSQANDQAMPEQAMEPTLYGYSPYHQPYYYPEPYGYSQYYDMSHVPQYEMYPTDPHASQAVYY
ncbi:hypothetical protein DEU56DRAFT_787790 [Suillus clintonianus]|uniref:uncharacterized protein n=1 Tax=Suillus clintonianus TaxID=1904413 RepID=UPI001B87CA3F|nr:uncharacterized protein DEU56DRAFT_787790 [Suillus clintonianus]KAG2145761.1 hypothetical protein DEU56DRAFT_787790 [Suillus clintonianus]